MELKAEQIKKALECCNDEGDCSVCHYERARFVDEPECTEELHTDALVLIKSQEQRIGAQDMTISELRKLLEKANHDADRYAVKIKELTEENERLRLDVEVVGAELSRYTENIVQMSKQDKANTVRKMQERLHKRFRSDRDAIYTGYNTHRYIDQIAKEMLEDTNEN